MALDPFSDQKDRNIFLLILLAILVLPTGPTDLLVIPFIVGAIGLKAYIILAISLIYVVFTHNKVRAEFEGRTGMPIATVIIFMIISFYALGKLKGWF